MARERIPTKPSHPAEPAGDEDVPSPSVERDATNLRVARALDALDPFDASIRAYAHHKRLAQLRARGVRRVHVEGDWRSHTLPLDDTGITVDGRAQLDGAAHVAGDDGTARAVGGDGTRPEVDAVPWSGEVGARAADHREAPRAGGDGHVMHPDDEAVDCGGLR